MSFKCLKCGYCCTVKGYVHISDTEVDAIATHLSMTGYDFVNAYTRLVNNRRGLSLTEKEDGSCVFLSEDRRCLINDCKPKQCRDFPQKWRFDGYEKECRGMNLNTAVDKFAVSARRASIGYSDYAQRRRTPQMQENRQPKGAK